MADDVRIRVAMEGTSATVRDAARVEDSIDDVGDAASRASRHIRGMNRSMTTTRVNLGPFSTSMRGATIAVGALINLTKAGVPIILSAGEAVAVLAGGAAGAGAVGLTGLAQASTVAKLGMGGLMDAIGGNETAIKNLTPEVRELFLEIREGQQLLQGTAQDGLIPGLTQGTRSAMRNLPVINRLVGRTARELGSLAAQGGGMLGSQEWGRDIATVGNANVRIIGDLGDAGLHLADAARHILVEAAPLAEWLAKNADEGARLLEVWTRDQRASGGLAQFFREARRDMELLGSIGGHTGRGLINIFGAQDVDGTRTLRSLDRLTTKFERWTSGPALQDGLGEALVDLAPDLGGKLIGGIATGMANAAPTAVSVFWDAFWEASTGGKFLTAAFIAKKLGAFKGAGKLLGGGALSGGIARGVSAAKPLPVWVVNNGPGGGLPGGGKGGKLGRLGRFGKYAPFLATRVGAPVAAGATAFEIGKALRNDVLRQRGADAGLTPEQIRARAARAHRGFVPLSGETPTRKRVVTDKQGFPTGEVIEVHVAPVNIDGQKVGELQATVIRRRMASN